MEVILIQDVDNLGGINEVVKVRNGYARNFLLPRKLAVEANPGNMKQLEEKRKQQQHDTNRDIGNYFLCGSKTCPVNHDQLDQCNAC